MLDRSNFCPSQNSIVEHIEQHDKCAVWSYMGSGKTVSTLTAFRDLYDRMDATRMLVNAPLRVARKVWRDEINEWAHLKGLTISHIIGDAKQRDKAMRTKADIHTLNRENTLWLQEQFLKGNKLRMRWPWDMVVIDESSGFKSADAGRVKALRRLLRYIPRLVELTGTPSPNGLHDLWAQFYLLDGGQRLGRKVGAFRDRWFDCVRDDGYTRWVPRDTAKKEIFKLVADITLSLEDPQEAVPVNPIRVELSDRVMTKYKRLEKEFLLDVGGQNITAANRGALSGKLLQLANGAVYDKMHVWHEIHQEKLDALIETIELLDKCIIGYAFQHDYQRIGARLDKLCGKKRKWKLLRSDADFAAWARGEIDYGVLHPASAGHGLNDVYKSGCEDLVWFGLTNNLEFFLQLNARLAGGHRRTGRNVRLHAIVCDGTYDAKQFPLLRKKDVEENDLIRAVAEYRKEVLRG